MTHLPSLASAEAIADSLISKKLAACVNIMSPCTSIYQWQGKTEKADELPVLIKSTMSNYPMIEKTIVELHPYELPEIIYVTLAGGLPAYMAWLTKETTL